jgi:ribosomal protein S1
LLTIDTVPFCQTLWNYSEGKQVEEEDIHGSVDSMLEEMASCGFAVESMELANWLPESRVGMARIKAKLNYVLAS